MIADLLKTRFLITKANELEEGDFDKIDQLHAHILTSDSEDDKVSDEVNTMYQKYRFGE
jgi:hypothetical protein